MMVETVDLTLLGQRINRLDDTLAAVVNRLNRLESSIATVDSHVGALTAMVRRLDERLDHEVKILNERFDRIEALLTSSKT